MRLHHSTTRIRRGGFTLVEMLVVTALVLLVMLATQAMTAKNLDYLRILQEYGKTVILVINQVDAGNVLLAMSSEHDNLSNAAANQAGHCT